MDPQWEFEAPQFVDFTNLDNEDEVSVILSFNVLVIKLQFNTSPNYLFYFQNADSFFDVGPSGSRIAEQFVNEGEKICYTLYKYKINKPDIYQYSI